MANVADVHSQVGREFLLEVQAELLGKAGAKVCVIELDVDGTPYGGHELPIRIYRNGRGIGAQKCRGLISVRRDKAGGAVALGSSENVAVVLHGRVIDPVSTAHDGLRKDGIREAESRTHGAVVGLNQTRI